MVISGHCSKCGRLFQFENTPEGRRVEKAFDTHECKRPDASQTAARIMPSKLKVGDAVFYGNPPVSYFVEDVDYSAKTADIRTTAGPVLTHKNVAWSELVPLDESQNALRVVREATGD